MAGPKRVASVTLAIGWVAGGQFLSAALACQRSAIIGDTARTLQFGRVPIMPSMSVTLTAPVVSA